MIHSIRRLLLVGLFVLAGWAGHTPVFAQDPSYLVLAPDRGFLGNAEMRDVFDAFQEHEPQSALAFATYEETTANLESALDALPVTEEVVVLPFFLTPHHALYETARSALDELNARDEVALQVAEPFGQSYLAEEVLFDRVEALADGSGSEALVVIGYGAASGAQADGLRAAMQPMVDHARQKYGLAAGHVTVHYGRAAAEETSSAAFEASIQQVQEAAAQHERVLVVPFNLGMRYTAMMADWNWTQRRLQGIDGVVADGASVLPHPNALRWLRRTANAYRPLAQDDIGVILVPHGSDYNWNERMREGVAPITEEYNVEESFSMVDPVVIERAVRQLEDEGARAAVVVRIFSLEANFKSKAEYVLGLRPEHEGGMGGRFPTRIESHLRFATLGGLEAHPLFARALLDRAQALSTDPSNETVILLAHGTGSDARNEHWMNNLATIADTMRARGGDVFRDINYHTWREDWPEKRKQTIPEIRQMVDDAAAGDGTAIVIPARTTAQGRAEQYLGDLDYRYGTGFAPHPLFVEWLRDQIEQGIRTLNRRPETVGTASTTP